MIIPISKRQSKPYSMAAIRERFIEVVTYTKENENINQTELCDKWKITPQQLSNVIGGRDLTMSILIAALQYSKVNLNYVIGGIGPLYAVESTLNGDKSITNISHTKKLKGK